MTLAAALAPNALAVTVVVAVLTLVFRIPYVLDRASQPEPVSASGLGRAEVAPERQAA